MAVYGISYYGDSTYGHDLKVDFDASPLVAEPEDYSRISLTWRSPLGEWDTLRILRNRSGFSVDETDGEVVAEFTGPATSAVDENTRPGGWHYYTVWVHSSTGWSRAALASTLMYQDNGYAERLFESLPVYHRLVQGANDDLPPVENETLKSFLSVLAVGLDYIKSYYDNLRVLNDPMKNHLEQLVRLGEQFGIEYLPVTPAGLYRSRVRNAGTLARSKGTLEHLQSVIGTTVGWDVELAPGPNLMLNEDAASFIHPVKVEWDPDVNYAVGERVSFGGFVYAAKPGGAYGEAQKPSGLAADNTWWTWINGGVDTTYAASDGTVAGWGVRSFTAGVTPGTFATALGIGVQSALDPTVQTQNVLILRNNNSGGAVADLGAISAGATDVDPLNAVIRGVPVPKADRAWDSTIEYSKGSLVRYKNLPYRALSKNQNFAPSGTTADNTLWACLGTDGRPRVTGSVYTSGGSNSTGMSRLTYPLMDFFDDKGTLLVSLDGGTDTSAVVLDSFATAPGALVGRTTDAGAKVWAAYDTWSVNPSAIASPPAATTGAFAYVGTAADGQVFATFLNEGYAGRKQALALRFAGASLSAGSYLKATRTAIYSHSGGADTLLANYTTPFKDGDRITVSLAGTAVKVYRNGLQVAAVTTGLNSGSNIHGMLVV